MRAVTDEDRYLFDLNGYVVFEQALTPEEVGRLNESLDEHQFEVDALTSPRPKSNGASSVRTGVVYQERFRARREFLYWGQQFRDLIDHPAVLPALKEWVDPCVRLDHYYPVFKRAGARDHDLHYGATPHIPVAHYHTKDGRIYAGFTVVSWALRDMPAGQGGFGCIPGSHKASIPVPPGITASSRNPAVEVHMRAGDVLIFTEALTHGAYAWTAAHDRRSLLFKYAPGYAIYSDYDWPDDLLELMTPAQRLLMEPPYISSERAGPPTYYRREVGDPSDRDIHELLDARVALHAETPVTGSRA